MHDGGTCIHAKSMIYVDLAIKRVAGPESKKRLGSTKLTGRSIFTYSKTPAKEG